MLFLATGLILPCLLPLLPPDLLLEAGFLISFEPNPMLTEGADGSSLVLLLLPSA